MVLYSTAMLDGSQAVAPGRRETRRWFDEHGYAGTNLSDLARELGGSKRTLWSHFDSKADLFAAVVDDLAERVRPLALDLGAGELRVELERFANGFVRAVTSDEVLLILRLVVAESGRFPEIAATFWDHGPKVTRRNLAVWLERRMAAGELRAVDPLAAAARLLHLIEASPQQALLWRLNDTLDDADLTAGAREAVDLFLLAYAPEARAGDRN